MQAPQTTVVAVPPDDVLVALFSFAIAAARRFSDEMRRDKERQWERLDEIKLGIGSPYTIRAPAAPILNCLLGRTPERITPFGDNDPDEQRWSFGSPKHTVLIALDFDRTGPPRPDSLFQARAWMIFNPGRVPRSAYLTVSPADRGATEGAGNGAYIVRAEADPENKRRSGGKSGNGQNAVWADDLNAVVFGGKAQFLCEAPWEQGRLTHVVRPERDAIVTIFEKQDGSLYQGKWRRKSGDVIERLILPPPTDERASYSRFGSLSLSPSGRFLSWREPGPPRLLAEPPSPGKIRRIDPTAYFASLPAAYRRILDLARPVPVTPSSPSAPMRIPLSERYVLWRNAFWIDDEEWIEIADYGSGPRSEWQVFSRLTGKVVRTLLQPPIRTQIGEIFGLDLLGYDSSTREIIAYAFPPGPGDREIPFGRNWDVPGKLAMIHRDTGALRLVDLDEGPLRQEEQSVVDACVVRPGGKEFLWTSQVIAGRDPNFRTVAFWRGSLARGNRPIVRFQRILTLQQPTSSMTENPYAMPALFDANGDVLLEWSGALWVVPRTHG